MAIYYVATNGNNAHAGTTAQPFKTIQYGIEKLRAGDKLMIRAGIYKEVLSVPAIAGGTTNAKTQIFGEPGVIVQGGTSLPGGAWKTGSVATVPGGTSNGYTQGWMMVMRANHIEIAGIEIDGSRGSGIRVLADTAFGVGIHMHDIVVHDVKWQLFRVDPVDGCLFERITCYNGGQFAQFSRSASDLNWPNAVALKDSFNTIIRGFVVYQHWGEGIGISGSDNIVEDCTVFNNYSAHIYANRVQRLTVRNCFIYHPGVTHLRGGSTPNGLAFNNEAHDKQSHRDPTRWVWAYNNVIVGLGPNVRFMNQSKEGEGLQDIYIYNNTLVEGRDKNVRCNIQLLNTTFINVEFTNNVIVQTLGDLITGTNNYSGLRFKNNLWWNGAGGMPPAGARSSGDLYVNPKLVNAVIPSAPGTGVLSQYNIQSTSPVINAGTGISGFTSDIYGYGRVGNPDLGAFEYQGGDTAFLVGNAPLYTQFTDTSSGCPTSTWEWSHSKNNGSSWTVFANIKNPRYSFTTPGVYGVRLKASCGGEVSVKTKFNYIKAN